MDELPGPWVNLFHPRICLGCCAQHKHISFSVPFTVMARGVVLAAQALPCHKVAVLSMAITLAGLAARKSPVAW